MSAHEGTQGSISPFPSYEQLYVAADTEMNTVELCCDLCGKQVMVDGTINLMTLLDAAAHHRTQHTSGAIT